MVDTSTGDREAGHVWLDTADYDRLRRATETYREELLVRLGGEVGLRTAEMVRVRPGDLGRYRGNHHFLTVRDADDEPVREAYLPADVGDAVRKYARNEGLRPDDQLFEVSSRRIQMLISTVADRAADRTGDRRFEQVTSSDLRRYFARRLLVEARVDPQVVMAVGGWSGFESLGMYLREPDKETIVAEFKRVSRFRTTREGSDPQRLAAALDAAGHAVYVVDADGHFEYVNDTFEAVTGHPASEVIGRSPGQMLSGASGSYVEVWRTIGRGDVWEGQLAFRHADGGSVPLGMTVAPLTSEGKLSGYVAVGRADATADGEDAGTPERVHEVVEGIRTLGDALTDCATREEVETAVCESLTDVESYVAAWVSRREPDGDLTVEAHAGDPGADPHTLASDEAAAGVIRDSIRTQEPLFERAGDLPGDWQGYGFETLVCVPVVGDRTRSTLLVGVASPRLPEWERQLLSDLGGRVGRTVAAIERRKLLVADTVLDLEFVVEDDRALLVRLAAECGCQFQLEGMVPATEGSMLYFLRSTGASSGRVVEAATADEAVADARLVHDHTERSLLELVVTGDSPAMTLVEQGGRVRRLSVEDRAVVVAEFARDTDVRTVADRLTGAFPGADLQAKSERERAIDTTEGFRRRLTDRLTDRQLQSLRAAYHAGYFEWPRGSTAEELADSMNVSSPTLHNHLRRAQQKLLTAFFDEESGDT